MLSSFCKEKIEKRKWIMYIAKLPYFHIFFCLSQADFPVLAYFSTIHINM